MRVIDVACSAGSVDVVKFLPMSHDAEVSRQTLEMAIASGCFEVIRLVWDRLPESERAMKLSFLRVAADWHRHDVFEWLFRDALDDER